MLSAILRYKSSDIHYVHFGNGPALVIGLHGYGESATSFNFLQETLSTDYWFIAIDFPYHGCTEWKEQHEFTNMDLERILLEIFKALGISEKTFIIMGFSMGARIALSFLEHAPQRIRRLVLLAPDGMKVNFWYWLATQTKLGNRLFYFIMKHPNGILKILQVSNRLNLINKSIFKFINTYLEDEIVRMELFNRWTCMRTFKPDLEIGRRIIRQQHLPVRIVYGQHDRIILLKSADRFKAGLESLCQVYLIDSGHQVLQKKYAGIITRLLTT